MQKRANVLKETQPQYAHLLINNNTIVVALNASEIKNQTAEAVRKGVWSGLIESWGFGLTVVIVL